MRMLRRLIALFVTLYVTANLVAQTSCVGITNQPQTLTVAERGSGTFSLMATSAPQFIQWYRQNSGGGFAAIPSANSNSYTIASAAYPGDNGAQFRATVSNSLCNVTSSVATLTVIPDTTPPTVVRAVGQLALDTIVISFSEPMDAGVLDTGSFFLYESTIAGDPSSTPYQTYSLTLTNQTNVIMQTDYRDLGKNYLVQIAYAQDNSFNHNALSPVPTNVVVRQQLPLIGFDVNNEWKYFVSTNVDLWSTAPNWYTVAYDDSSWLSGPGALGFDTSIGAPQPPVRTQINFSGSQPTANRFSEPSFFRRHFTYPASTNGAVLILRHVLEDGGVVYLNGQIAYSNNAPPGPYMFSSRAPTNADDPAPIVGPFQLPLTNLIAGDNVIAVLVLQNGAQSSDVLMALELTAEVTNILTGPPQIVGQPQSQTVNEGQSVTFNVFAEGEVPLVYQWHKGASTLPGKTNGSLTLDVVTPGDAGNYFVNVANALGFTNSLPATLTVLPAPGYTYTLTLATNGAGAVSRAPDQLEYISNSIVSLTATPSPGWGFSGWSGDASGTNNPLDVVMTNNKSITVHFAATSSITWDPLESTCRHASLSIL